MALALDFLQHPVNVHWGAGLAVEFTDRPDYLTMNSIGLNMSKVIISFWFRIPTETANVVRQANPPFSWGEQSIFQGVVPLIGWGPQLMTPVTTVNEIDTGAFFAAFDEPIIIEELGAAYTAPLQPSCLGVYVGDDLNPATFLQVHIQTNVNASASGLLFINSDFTGIPQVVAPGSAPEFGDVVFIRTDVSEVVTETPERLGNLDHQGQDGPHVTLDKWHHLLISWDITTGITCKMWCALDDVNKNGDDLPAMRDPDMGPNDHLSLLAWKYRENPDTSVVVAFDSASVPSSPVQIPSSASALRATDDVGGVTPVAPIRKVELAELQVFSGVTLDTSSETNRRAFIDFERDKNGTPITDEDGNRTLKPVNPKKAEELLDKKPDVLLHGSSKWQDGKNTGSLGIDADGNEIPSGQFAPTGDIEKYKPDPSITEA